MLPSLLLYLASKHSKEGIRSYSSYIDAIEDAFRGLSLLLPGRVDDGELFSQSILATLSLVSLYHTKFLVQSSFKINSISEKGEKSSILNFNQHFSKYNQSKWATKTASWTLSVISYTEVLAEILLNRMKVPKTSKWKYIASLEGAKAILRLVLYYGTKKQMILHPTHFIRNVDPNSLDISEEDKFELLALDPRTGTSLTLNNDNNQHQNTTPTLSSNTKTQKRWAHFGELLWIARPFIYAIMIYLGQRRKRQSEYIPSEMKSRQVDKIIDDEEDDEEISIEKEEEASWKPWLVSFAIDLLSRTARHMQYMTGLERDESKRRDYLFIYYLFRGPIYLTFTRLLLDKFCDATEHRPLISVITVAINEYRPFWENFYFYTAGS